MWSVGSDITYERLDLISGAIEGHLPSLSKNRGTRKASASAGCTTEATSSVVREMIPGRLGEQFVQMRLDPCWASMLCKRTTMLLARNNPRAGPCTCLAPRRRQTGFPDGRSADGERLLDQLHSPYQYMAMLEPCITVQPGTVIPPSDWPGPPCHGVTVLEEIAVDLSYPVASTRSPNACYTTIHCG